VEWWSNAARRTARLCSSRRSGSSRSTAASSAAASGGATSTTPSVTSGTPEIASASRSAVLVSAVRRTPWKARAAATTPSVTGPLPERLTSRARSTTGWSQSFRKPTGLKIRSSTGSGPGSVTTVGARSITWCSATPCWEGAPRRATTTSGGTSRSASPAPATSGSSTDRASRPGAAARPAYDTTRPPWVVSPGPAAWRAISITTSWARAPVAKRATVSTPRSPASRAARWTRRGHSGRGTSTHGVGESVSQQATARHWPRRGTALAIRRSRARSAATTRTEPHPLRGPSSVDSGTIVGSRPGRSSMPCSASSARLSESSTMTSVGPGSRTSWRGCVTVVRAP